MWRPEASSGRLQHVSRHFVLQSRLSLIARRLEASDLSEIEDGGSPARLFKASTPDGPIVIKYLEDAPGRVDGHDLASFRHKVDQIEKIHAERAGLSPFYTELLAHFGGPGWYTYVMPYYDGVSLARMALEGSSPEHCSAHLERVASVLLTRGYLRSRIPVSPSFLDEVHLGRIFRRQWILRQAFPEALSGARLLINGRSCRPALQILHQIGESPELRRMLTPRWLYYPAHGDANLSNFLVRCGPGCRPEDSRFIILDPRGITCHWDPIYDFGKMLFSLTLFTSAMLDGFEISRDGCHRSGVASYTVRLRAFSGSAGAAGARQLIRVLQQLPEFTRGFAEDDPHWPTRLLFTHAVHVLAESACRLSDRTVPKGTHECRRERSAELALGFYLRGTLILNDLIDRHPGTIDAAAHLKAAL